MHRGYIKIWRKLEDSGLLQIPNTLSLFMVMLFKAAYKPCKIGLLELDRGQLSAGRFQLCEWTGLSEQNIRTSLKHLHDMEIITSKPTNKFTVYTIVNYGQYQDNDDANNQQLTNKQPATNQQLTTIKETNHLSIKEKPIAEFSEGFIKFWETWPASKRKGGKSECFKKWKDKKLEPIADEIIKHVIYCKGNGIWKDTLFIEAPMVYINQAKWDGAEISEKDKPFNKEEWLKSI